VEGIDLFKVHCLRINVSLMAKSFEDTEVWQGSREPVKLIYAATKERDFRRGPVLVGQIRKAVLSVMSDMAEGFERRTHHEIIQFLYIAKGS
jgi:four helix bundle protein